MGSSSLPGTSSLSEVSDGRLEISLRSRNSHRHVPIRLLEATRTGEHFLGPLPKAILNDRCKTRGSRRPVLVGIPSDTNPAVGNDAKKNLSPSLALNADSLSIFFIGGFDLFPRQTEPVRVADNGGDVTVGDMDKVSRW